MHFSPHSMLYSTSWLYATHQGMKIHSEHDIIQVICLPIMLATEEDESVTSSIIIVIIVPLPKKKFQTANLTFYLHILEIKSKFPAHQLFQNAGFYFYLFSLKSMCHTLQNFLVNHIFHYQTTHD